MSGVEIGIAGAGQFTAGVILPLLHQLKAPLKTIVGRGGFHSAALAKKYNIPKAAAGFDSLLADAEIGLVLIATPHQYHAQMAAQAMRSGKDVFLEKPMAIDRQGLEKIIQAKEETGRLLYVGYNRRFAPLALKAKNLLRGFQEPAFIVYNINAGRLPENHGLQNESVTGGRLLGEVCHFIDSCVFLQGAAVTGVFAREDAQQNVSILLSFSNGAQAVINYFSSGSSVYPKERIELHRSGRSLVIDNWRSVEGYGIKTASSLFPAQDKGHKAQFQQLLASWPQRKELIPFHELVNVGSATLAVKESIELGGVVELI